MGENQSKTSSARADLESKLKRLQAERDQARLLFNMANAIILVLDKRANVVEINTRGAQMLGGRPEDIEGRNWIDEFVPEEDWAGVREVFSGIIGSGGDLPDDVKNHINYVKTVDGRRLLVHWSNTALRDEDGRINGTISSGLDMTKIAQGLDG